MLKTVKSVPAIGARSRSAGRAATRQAARADGSRANILAMATREFSEKGFTGARVDEIAERIDTSKRMIYYYFGSKEGLYRAVLEQCYTQVRQIDTSLDLDRLAPAAALRQLVYVTFDYHNKHPDFVRIVMNENINKGAQIGTVSSIKTRAKVIISMLQKLINRGASTGVFRADIDPVDLHMAISALCFYNVSNRYTFGRVFQRNMTAPGALASRRETVANIIERWCCIKP